MNDIIRTWLLMVFFIMLISLQINADHDSKTNRFAKDFVELAAHDAALALDEEQLAKGKIVFDQQQAEENFINSLAYHLDLNADLTPKEHSFFQDEIDIVLMEFFDHDTPDPNNPNETITFPYTYSNSQYDIIDVLNGPGIVVVVEAKSPRHFRGDKRTIRRATVYEYVY